MVRPALKEVRRDLKVQWYRCFLGKGVLTELQRRSDVYGAIQSIIPLLVWISTAKLVLGADSMATLAISLILHGTIGSTFVYACHELGHGTVFKTAILNKAFLLVYSFLFWWDPYMYAASHTYHHRYTQHADGDRENLPPLVPSLDPSLLLQLFTLNLTTRPSNVFGKGGLLSTIQLTVQAAFGGVAADRGTNNYEWLQAIRADPAVHDSVKKSRRFSFALVIMHLVVTAFALWYNKLRLIAVVSLHSFFGNWLSYFIGMCQHCGMESNAPDFRLSTRSIALPFAVEFLFWRMNWHLEHHMFANVPCYNLWNLHKHIKDDLPPPKDIFGAWSEMREIYARKLSDPGYEHKIHVPSRGTSEIVGVSDEGGGIGDIAPAGL